MEDDSYNQVKGSLRFNYMFPIDDKYVVKRNFNLSKNAKRKEFLRRQWVYCNTIVDEIKKMAQDTYDAVISGKDKKLVYAACDFRLLEEAAKLYTN